MEMKAKSAHIMQHVSTDNMQQAVVQTVQKMISESVEQVNASTEQSISIVPVPKSSGGQNIGSSEMTSEDHFCQTASGEDEEEEDMFCNSSELPKSNGHESTWQDDEDEYVKQMNILNADWKKPDVDEIMKELLKGRLSVTEAAAKISAVLGREIAISSVRSRALDCAAQPLSLNLRKAGNREDTSNLLQPLATKEFGPGVYEVIRNIRGNLNSIAVKEPQGDCVRIYRRSTTRFYYSYYRCSTCDHLSQRKVLGKHPTPIIKMVHDQIVGEPFPPHLPDCKPLPLSRLRAIQIDRENRQEMIDEMQTPFEAWSKGHLRALLEEAKKASQLAKKYSRWKRSSRSRREIEMHNFGRPYGDTLTSYEENIRRRLNKHLERSISPANSLVSEWFSTRAAANGGWSIKRPRSDDSLQAIKDEVQSPLSDSVEARDANGLLPDERAHIDQLKVIKKDNAEQKDGKEMFSAQGICCSGVVANSNQNSLRSETPGSENRTEDELNADNISVHSFSTSNSNSYCRKHPTVETDETGRDVIRETRRKIFIVDDEHLLNLFRRCPDCGERLKTIALSSIKAVPIITYKCHGRCENIIWFGYEPK